MIQKSVLDLAMASYFPRRTSIAFRVCKEKRAYYFIVLNVKMYVYIFFFLILCVFFLIPMFSTKTIGFQNDNIGVRVSKLKRNISCQRINSIRDKCVDKQPSFWMFVVKENVDGFYHRVFFSIRSLLMKHNWSFLRSCG